jgi:hypothetical protein
MLENVHLHLPKEKYFRRNLQGSHHMIFGKTIYMFVKYILKQSFEFRDISCLLFVVCSLRKHFFVFALKWLKFRTNLTRFLATRYTSIQILFLYRSLVFYYSPQQHPHIPLSCPYRRVMATRKQYFN